MPERGHRGGRERERERERERDGEEGEREEGREKERIVVEDKPTELFHIILC